MGENQNSGGYSDDPSIGQDEIAAVELFKDINPDEITPEQARTVITTAKTLQAQKRRWREIAIDPSTGKPYKDAAVKPANVQTPPAQQPAAPPELVADVAELKLEREKRTFGHANGLDPEETDHLFAFAAGAKLTPAQALSHPFFKNGLTATRQQKQNSGATPGSSRRAPTVEGKTFAKMTPQEREKNFGTVVGALKRK